MRMVNENLNSNNFSERVLSWFASNGRHDLPWQHPREPYRVWLAEIMLQQTQVQTVIGYFDRFIQRFPLLADLARAESDEVMRYWAGLGYYARARNLHLTAQIIQQHYAGQFPRELDALMQLPGIGRSTAGAILAQAFGLRHPILDGNVKRVLARFHGVQGWTGDGRVQKQLWQHAEQHTPHAQLADYTQAIMDLGATLCSRSKPQCVACPIRSDCYAYQNQATQQLPTKKLKKPLPVKATYLLVLRDAAGRILLEKRPPTGIWGGLWSLPEATLDADLDEECQRRWGLILNHCETGASFRHTFSHYHLDITPCYAQVKNPALSVMEDDRWLWYNSVENELPGVPAPVSLILGQRLTT